MKRYWVAVSKEIPKYELQKEHIQNLKAVLTREELLELLPANGVVAEIGVDQGDFSQLILSKCKPQKLHLIDMWSSKRYHSGLRDIVEKKFTKQIASGKVEINIGYSTEVADTFEDSYFDWIYIDSSHSYKVTIEELHKYSSKVKPDGIIAGHDFIIGNWNGQVRYGVIEAVYEFCVKENWELIYITMENQAHQSFAIKRIEAT